MVDVLIWDNQGVKTTKRVENLAAGKVHAKMARSLQNRTVKLADAGGSTHHWKRSTHLAQNHWAVMAVDGEFLKN